VSKEQVTAPLAQGTQVDPEDQKPSATQAAVQAAEVLAQATHDEVAVDPLPVVMVLKPEPVQVVAQAAAAFA
jgi:hypothetical protein